MFGFGHRRMFALALALFCLGPQFGFRLPSGQRIGVVAKQLQAIERTPNFYLRATDHARTTPPVAGTNRPDCGSSTSNSPVATAK
jgi:hypothetical protein